MRAVPLVLAALALASCGDPPQSSTKPPPRGKAVKETRSRARQRIDDSKLSPKLKQELREAQDLLVNASKD